MKFLKKLNKNYLYGAICGVFGSLCLVSLGTYLYYAMSEAQVSSSGEIIRDLPYAPDIHPSFYAIAMIVCALSFVITLVTAIWNGVLLRKTQRRTRAVLIMISITVVTYILFIFIWGMVWYIICAMLAWI